MSLQGWPARPVRSAWVTSEPPGSMRRRSPLREETMSMRPSGSQPVPMGMAGTRAMTSLLPSRSTATTSPAPMSENHRRSSCQRGDSPNARPVIRVCSAGMEGSLVRAPGAGACHRVCRNRGGRFDMLARETSCPAEEPVKYMILISSNPASRQIWESFSAAQRAEGWEHYAALTEDLNASGEMIVSEALADPSLAKRIYVREGQVMTSDGPFAEAKEHLAGFFLVECESIERAVGGLSTAEIARAFLVPGAVIGQRISRAKQKIKASGAEFRMPGKAEFGARVTAALRVLYLIFNEGYTATSGPALQRVELTAEAIRLARQLRDRLPDDGEVSGLLALMLLTDARRPARTRADGHAEPDRGQRHGARPPGRLAAAGRGRSRPRPRRASPRPCRTRPPARHGRRPLRGTYPLPARRAPDTQYPRTALPRVSRSGVNDLAGHGLNRSCAGRDGLTAS